MAKLYGTPEELEERAADLKRNQRLAPKKVAPTVKPRARPTPLGARKTFNAQQAVQRGREGIDEFITKGKSFTKKAAAGWKARSEQVARYIMKMAGYGGEAVGMPMAGSTGLGPTLGAAGQPAVGGATTLGGTTLPMMAALTSITS